jgi:hypothetical protein
MCQRRSKFKSRLVLNTILQDLESGTNLLLAARHAFQQGNRSKPKHNLSCSKSGSRHVHHQSYLLRGKIYLAHETGN